MTEWETDRITRKEGGERRESLGGRKREEGRGGRDEGKLEDQGESWETERGKERWRAGDHDVVLTRPGMTQSEKETQLPGS